MIWRHLASNALSILLVVVFLLAGALIWGQRQYTVAGPLEEAICFQVERGATIARVSNKLEAQEAITSGALFRISADYAGKADKVKAGSFLLAPGASMQDIVDTVTRGGASNCGTEVIYRIGVTRLNVQVRELDPAQGRFVERAQFQLGVDESDPVYSRVRENPDTRYRIAFAEGVTSWQVVDALRKIDLLEGDIGTMPPEGALAPQSYEVGAGDNRAALVAQMQQVQELRVLSAWAKRNPDLPLESPEELVTLASIIEKETGIAGERGKVASVFVNRLNQGMRLQTDPTVIYGITKGEGTLGRGLRSSELRKRTPWNTYVIDGLPPTPIANPGLASLEAAANPEKTDYIFFVADGTGGHEFTTNLRDHNAAVARWRKIEAERRNAQGN